MGITDGAISPGMPSAFRILTRALPVGLVAALAAPAAALAAGSADATGLPNVSLKVGNSTNNPGTTLTILGLLTLLTVAPSILVMMTGFTRILIVLSFVRNALGTQNMPPNQVLVGFALFLSLFVMAPTLRQVNHDALQPYLAHKIEAKQALLKAEIPIKRFMLKQTRASDLALFIKLAHQKPPASRDKVLAHDARARVHDLGAEDGVRDRVPRLHPVPDHRPRDLVDAHVDGHDDAAARPDLAAVQDPAVRARRRLGAPHAEPRGGIPHVTQAFLQTLMGRTITVALELAVPTLAVSLGVGLLVSVLQAVTQIQEMTLTFIPKVFAVGLTMVLLGPWMLDTMLAFTVEVYKQIPAMTAG